MSEVSDGTTAKYYELPKGATELYHLIIHKDMNAQLGEIFRAAYRYGESSHSDQLRDIRKIIAYAKQEEERLLKEDELSAFSITAPPVWWGGIVAYCSCEWCQKARSNRL